MCYCSQSSESELESEEESSEEESSEEEVAISNVTLWTINVFSNDKYDWPQACVYMYLLNWFL